MKVIIKNVEGTTAKRGSKQNKTYTIVSRGDKNTIVNGKLSDQSNWYKAIDDKNKEYMIWNVHYDWTIIGISKIGKYTMSYTTTFEVIDLNLFL